MVTRVVLVGFSGTGKSTIGRVLADRLGWDLLDLDNEIERREGMPIPDFFQTRGEPAFRAVEQAIFYEALGYRDTVIATGGGAVCTDDIWPAIREEETFVVRFDASPEELVQRLENHRAMAGADETARRPMLDSDDPLGRIRTLLSRREHFYQRADVTIPVGRRLTESTVNDVLELVDLANDTPSTVSLEVRNASSRIVVGPGARASIDGLLSERWPNARHAWIAADTGFAHYHQDWLNQLGTTEERSSSLHLVPSGESSKSLAGLADLYDWMIGDGVERGDIAIATGGGVTGDLMGFAASSVLRGIGLMQVPTTLLSMVDSSVGGKTGINHPGGKNLIGSFYQPSLVVVDPMFLESLPQRELRSGFAEIIKHGVIQASTPGGEGDFMSRVLERNADGLLKLREPVTSWVIRQNISLKTAVVAADEKESRLRAILNFGHTIGHGVEAAGYSLLHGEAVAVGMLAAMTIAVGKELAAPQAMDRLASTIEAYGLPVRADFDADVVREKMTHDKKKSDGAQQWILPIQSGGVAIRTDVEEEEIEAALTAIKA